MSKAVSAEKPHCLLLQKKKKSAKRKWRHQAAGAAKRGRNLAAGSSRKIGAAGSARHGGENGVKTSAISGINEELKSVFEEREVMII